MSNCELRNKDNEPKPLSAEERERLVLLAEHVLKHFPGHRPSVRVPAMSLANAVIRLSAELEALRRES